MENVMAVKEKKISVKWAFKMNIHKSDVEIVAAGEPVELPLAKALEFGALVGVTSDFQSDFDEALKSQKNK